jgi:hypothetical protein
MRHKHTTAAPAVHTGIEEVFVLVRGVFLKTVLISKFVTEPGVAPEGVLMVLVKVLHVHIVLV